MSDTNLGPLAPQNTYGDLLHVATNNTGVSATPSTVYDGLGNATTLAIGTNNLSINGITYPLSPGTDGQYITINGSNQLGFTTLNNIPGNASTVTVASNSTNATYYPTFVTAQSGSLSPQTNTSYNFNPSTGALTAATFVGAVTGNVTGNCSGSSGSCTGNAATATLASTLTTAASTANSDFDVMFCAGTGSSTVLVDTATPLKYHPSTGTLTTTTVVAALQGNVTGNVSGSSGSCTGNSATATLATTVTTNANLTGPITSVGNGTSIASQTGTGTKFVVDTSPTLVTPNVGVATATSVNKVSITAPTTSATLTIDDGFTLHANGNATVSGTNTGDQTNISGNAATVTTNANLTGEVTSTGNAALLDKTSITNRTEDTTPDAAADYLISYDASANALKKVLMQNLPTGSASNALTITVANEGSDTTCFPAFFTDATGNLAGKTNAALTFNASTVNLSSTTFTGALVGNASTATKLAATKNIGGVAFDGSADITPTNTTVASDTTNATYYVSYVSATSGAHQEVVNTGFTVNPSTNNVTASTFTGNLTGNVTGNCTGSSGSCTGNSATVTTNANLTGDVTSSGNATTYNNTVPVTKGGTGVTTMTTAYAPICAGTTATGNLQVASTGLSTSGYVYTSNGSSALPSFKAPSISLGIGYALSIGMYSA